MNTSHTRSRRARLALLALVLFTVPGCLAEPRTEAELLASIAEAEGSQACTESDKTELINNGTKKLGICLTGPAPNGCANPRQCAGECIIKLPISDPCRSCVNTNVASCIAGSCGNKCPQKTGPIPCPSCAGECETCIKANCDKQIEVCTGT